jgi:hypothetical protein
MTGLTSINGEFSFTLFVSPSSIFACVLVYLSSTKDNSDPSQAQPYLCIDSFGTLVAEFSPTVIVEAHVNMTANEWSHVALTYIVFLITEHLSITMVYFKLQYLILHQCTNHQ